MIETVKLLIIRIALSLLKPVRRRGLLEPTYERLRLAKLYREDVVQWRVETARAMGAKLGRGCRLYSLNFFSEPYLIELGDNVIVSGDVTFVTHDGGVYVLHGEGPGVLGNYGRITIGNNCFIGMGALILPNVRIGNNCVVAAGAVVNRSFGDNCVIMGNPAKTVLSFDMYRALKRDSPFTIRSDEYAYPRHDSMPESAKRDLIEKRLRDLPTPAPQLAPQRRQIPK